MRLHDVTIPEAPIAELCRRHRVARLSLFGSILTDRFSPDSDVDMLVEFEQGVVLGLMGFASLALELERLIGRRVDLREPEDLSHLFRAHVLREARLVHAA